MLWAIWCQRVEVAFREDNFHLGVILWQAWRNTIYCAMEAYKEIFRIPRNEEKKQELVSCFQKVWSQAKIFGRIRGGDLKWHLTPHPVFLPIELGAWNSLPIRINRLSPSPDPEAEFAAREDFAERVDDFLQGIRINSSHNEEPNHAGTLVIQPQPQRETNTLHTDEESQQGNTPANQSDQEAQHTNTPSRERHQSITPPRRKPRPKRKCFKRKRTHKATHDPEEITLDSPSSSYEDETHLRNKENLRP